MMLRNDKVLLHVKKTGFGVEIGASHNPIASKKAGYNVHTIDHATKAELQEKYKNDSVNLDKIEDVDFVWTGQKYAELTGKPEFYDWIIASHVIEHVPDLIGFINDCDEILNENGVISLVVPDVRYCFDYFRPMSGLSKVLDAHLQDNKVHTRGTIAEFKSNLVSKAGHFAWGETAFLDEEYEFLGLLNELQRQEYLKRHLAKVLPVVAEMETLKEKIKLNGHFKNLEGLDLNI